MKRLYLLFYNSISFFLWFFIFFQVLYSPLSFYSDISLVLKIAQTLAILDICHSYLGLSTSFKWPSFLQITTRLIFVWLILEKYEVTRMGWGPLLMIGSWSIIEVVRYFYYFLKVKNNGKKETPSFLVWFRYRLFIVLYPLGFAGEVFCLLKTNIIEGGMYILFVPYFLGLIFMMKHMFWLGEKKLKKAR